MNPVQSVGDAFINLFAQILSAIPAILAFLLIVVVGYLVAKALRTVTDQLLDRFGFDRTLHENEYGQYAERLSPGASPTRLIAGVVFWFVLLGAVAIAIARTNNPGLTSFLDAIVGYLPKVVAAVLIFVIAGAISTAVGAFVRRTMGDTATGQVVQAVVPVLVMGIAIFAILDQLEIAPDIVRIGFTALVGGLTLALALAFGLGGRDVAAQIIRDAYDKGQEQRKQVRRDYELGKERSRQDLDQAKEHAQEEHEAHPGGTGPSEPAATQPGAGGEGGPPASEPAPVGQEGPPASEPAPAQPTEETWSMSPGPPSREES